MTLYLRDYHRSAKGEKVYNVFSPASNFDLAFGAWSDSMDLPTDSYHIWVNYIISRELRDLGINCGGTVIFADDEAEMLFKLSAKHLGKH